MRRATWDDLNLPARHSTSAAAGLPRILKDNRGSRVAARSLVGRHDVGVFFDDFEDLAARLRDRSELATRTARMRAARRRFAFDADVDGPIARFRWAVRRRAATPGRRPGHHGSTTPAFAGGRASPA